MGFFSSLFGGSIAQPIEAIGNVLDKVTTTDAERAQAEAVLEKLRQHPAELQVELNKVEAQHPSVFVAGWRPAIGWVCAIGLFYDLVFRPISVGFGLNMPDLNDATLTTLIFSMLGLGTLRTVEKIKDKARN